MWLGSTHCIQDLDRTKGRGRRDSVSSCLTAELKHLSSSFVLSWDSTPLGNLVLRPESHHWFSWLSSLQIEDWDFSQPPWLYEPASQNAFVSALTFLYSFCFSGEPWLINSEISSKPLNVMLVTMLLPLLYFNTNFINVVRTNIFYELQMFRTIR